MTTTTIPTTDTQKTVAALGTHPWRIVLLHPRSKKPTGDTWNIVTDPAVILSHLGAGGNLGLLTRRETGVAVLDPDKILEWADMIDTLGQPGQAWVETGSGRLHYYVAWEPDLPAKLVWNNQIIGEIQRGPGQQQVVVPPSRHPENGRTYRWLVDPATEPLMPLPEEWRTYFRSLASPRPPRMGTDALNAALQQPGAKRRQAMVKFQCPACATEGHDRHQDNAAYFIGPRTWGCAWAKGTELGRVHWDAIGVALGRGGAAAGSASTESPPPTDSPSEPTLRVVGAGDFLAQEFPPAESYVEGILSSDGGGLLSGEEKVGKSLYAMAEGSCLALALPVCGRFGVPERRRVLFLEEEDPPRRAHGRLRALLRGQGLDPDDPAFRCDLNAWLRISVWSGFSLDSREWVAQLEAEIQTFRPQVVYLDALRKLTRCDLNKAQEAGAVLAVLDDLRRRYGCLFRVIHHYRKQQGFRTGRGSQEIAGSYVLGAWAESSMFFEPIGRKQGAVRVEIQTEDGGPMPGFRLRIEAEGPAQAPTLIRLVAEEDADPNDGDELVFQAVATLPKQEAVTGQPGVSAKAIATALGKSLNTVRRALTRLSDVDRCLLTGTMSKGMKLYGMKG